MKNNDYWITRTDPDNYRVFTRDKNDLTYIKMLNLLKEGKALSEVWNPAFLKLYAGDPNKEGDAEIESLKPVPDFAKGIIGLAVNKKTFNVIKPLVSAQVKFLKLDTEVGTYYELDINAINCINIGRSQSVLFPNGKIMRIEKYSFDWEKIKNIHIFKSADAMLKPIFVSDRFKETVEVNDLTGLTFHSIPLVGEK